MKLVTFPPLFVRRFSKRRQFSLVAIFPRLNHCAAG